jgi:hypothetical protein
VLPYINRRLWGTPLVRSFKVFWSAHRRAQHTKVPCFWTRLIDIGCTSFHVKFEDRLSISVLSNGSTLYKKLEFKTVEFPKRSASALPGMRSFKIQGRINRDAWIVFIGEFFEKKYSFIHCCRFLFLLPKKLIFGYQYLWQVCPIAHKCLWMERRRTMCFFAPKHSYYNELVTVVAFITVVWPTHLSFFFRISPSRSHTMHRCYLYLLSVLWINASTITALNPIVIKGQKFFDSVTKEQFFIKG